MIAHSLSVERHRRTGGVDLDRGIPHDDTVHCDTTAAHGSGGVAAAERCLGT